MTAIEPSVVAMPALPAGLVMYRQTPDFDEHSLPAGLRRSHTLKAGSWGRIVVLEGLMLYVIEHEPVVTFTLSPDHPGIIEPETPHHIGPQGHVRFRIEFHRPPT